MVLPGGLKSVEIDTRAELKYGFRRYCRGVARTTRGEILCWVLARMMKQS